MSDPTDQQHHHPELEAQLAFIKAQIQILLDSQQSAHFVLLTIAGQMPESDLRTTLTETLARQIQLLSMTTDHYSSESDSL